MRNRSARQPFCLLLLGGLLWLLSSPRGVAEEAAPPPPVAARPASPAQPPEEEKPAPARTAADPVREVVVTASRGEQSVLDTPRSMTVVRGERLAERQAASVLDVLDDQPGVWLEKRNSSNSNLILRGFGGANNLALVDGDSLTTLWGEGGEGGDDLYGKVEPSSLERVEVIRGPASVLYGSNCLGGVVNFITRKCPLDYAKPGKIEVSGRALTTFESACEGYHGYGESSLATESSKFLIAGGARNASDTRSGGGRYLTPSGGEKRNLNSALEFKLADEHQLELTYQHMDIDHEFRYYRPNQTNSNDRDAGHALWRWEPGSGAVRAVRYSNYLQRKKDRRFWDDGTSGRAVWFTWAQNAQVDLAFGPAEEHRLTFGGGHHIDWGESPDDEQFTTRAPHGPRVKAGPDSVWTDTSAYGLYEWSPLERLTLSVSARLDYFDFRTDVDEFYVPASPAQDPLLDEITAYRTVETWGGGAVYQLLPEPDLRLFANYARGFRLNPPVFGLTQHGQGVRAPSGMLDPILGDSCELGLRNQGEYLRGSLAGYYATFANFQSLVNGTFNGQDWFDFNADGVRQDDEGILVTQANGSAYLWGVEFSQDGRIDQLLGAPGQLWVGAGYAYNYGELDDGTPLRFTHPKWGLARLRWEQGQELWRASPVRKVYLEYTGRLVGRYDRIPAEYLRGDRGYLADPQDAGSPRLRSYGLPGYAVHDLRLGLQIQERWNIHLSIENLLDKKYRRAHSRWDEPGRNFIVGVEFNW